MAYLHSMKTSAAAALTAHLFQRSKSTRYRHNEGLLPTFAKVLNDILKKYATDEVIAATDTKVMIFTEPSKM